MLKHVAAVGCLAVLAGCQTIDYQQYAPGYEKQYALSACEIGAMGPFRFGRVVIVGEA